MGNGVWATLSLAISIGVGELNGMGDGLSLLTRADEALYRAKQQGRNRVCT